jgi:hypothetical protein
MTDMQTSLSLLIVWPSILNPVMHFSTQPLTGKMKCPRLYLCLAHFHSNSSDVWCNTCTNMINNDMIYFISSYDRIGSSILTPLALHPCVSPSAPSLTQASPLHVVPRFEASDLSFTLATGPSSQVMSWTSPTWSQDLVSCLMCNKLLHHHMCKLYNISMPFSPPWHMLLTHMYLWTNLLYISHKHN